MEFPRIDIAPIIAHTGSITNDQQLIQIVDDALAEAARLAGEHLACYAGCAVCCFGPFPITVRDAERLRRGWLHADPAVATEIAQRATAARVQLADAFPGDAASGLLNADIDEAAFAAQHENLACPVLDPDSGQCSLYDARPIACRLYGLPTRVDGHDAPHCPLCFRRAAPNEIEAARAIIESPASVRDHDEEQARTVIAYAIPVLSL
jgi:Fe-S-cluster containining protein